MRIYAPVSFSSCCHLHRLIYPCRYLAQDASQHDWQTALTDSAGEYDVLAVYGAQPLSNFPEFGSLKRKGVRLIWSIDDSYWDWPVWRHDVPSKEVVGCVDLLAEVADLIVASTPALADDIRKPSKTVVCPNLVEVAKYRTPTPPPDDDVIRICFSGSATHKGDLDLIDAACCRIKSKWGAKVDFHLFGAGPDELLKYHWGDGVHLTDWVPLSAYWWHLHQARPHICVAPLVDCAFNRAKSNIRVLEGWSLNAAVVASPVGDYKLVRDGVDGLIATTEDEWFDRLDRLIQDRQLREGLAREGYRRVSSDWNWASPDARQKWSGLVDVLDEWSAASNNLIPHQKSPPL